MMLLLFYSNSSLRWFLCYFIVNMIFYCSPSYIHHVLGLETKHFRKSLKAREKNELIISPWNFPSCSLTLRQLFCIRRQVLTFNDMQMTYLIKHVLCFLQREVWISLSHHSINKKILSYSHKKTNNFCHVFRNNMFCKSGYKWYTNTKLCENLQNTNRNKTGNYIHAAEM